MKLPIAILKEHFTILPFVGIYQEKILFEDRDKEWFVVSEKSRKRFLWVNPLPII
jgi:lipocalin